MERKTISLTISTQKNTYKQMEIKKSVYVFSIFFSYIFFPVFLLYIKMTIAIFLMSATKDPVNNFLPLIVTGFTLPFEKSAHVGRCYKFTVNTHSPAL